MELKNYITQWFDDCYEFMLKQFYCQIHLTKACEYHCLHCYFQEIPDISRHRFSVAEVSEILGKMKETSSKLELEPRIDFTGGDPLLHPDFFSIAEAANRHSIPFGIKGNPDLLLTHLTHPRNVYYAIL